MPYLLAFLTGHPRHQVRAGIDFEWSRKSWTHNLFRLWELIFWRRCGPNGVGDTIRRESIAWGLKDENGKEHVFHVFYTKEAAIAHAETLIREWVGSLRMPRIYVYLPQMAIPGMPVSIPTGYMFAIARDNNSWSNRTTTGTTYSFSYTCTGSNLILVSMGYSPTGNDTITETYNSVSLTSIASAANVSADTMTSFYLTNPSTGSNTLAMTAASGFPLALFGVSYTGAAQSGQPDAHKEGSNASTKSISVTVTTVANNSWIAGFFYGGTASGTFSASGSFTILHAGAGTAGSGDWNALCSLDTNAAITPAGATSVGASWTNDGTNTGILCAVSVSPVSVTATAIPSLNLRSLLGVGT